MAFRRNYVIGRGKQVTDNRRLLSNILNSKEDFYNDGFDDADECKLCKRLQKARLSW